MATISTYVSGHTELNDVAEFFQKQLLNAGERPIAFFDGVFYESHQERVGNIAYQDYLIYSDRAVYLWARGATKDYLDRFSLGAVSINSRNKDNDFATLNLRIRREGKEPVYVIFDMVEVNEAEKIFTLHTIIESTIETYLGSNFRYEIPDDVADQIFLSAANTCPPKPLNLMPPGGQPYQPPQSNPIGYGQDLLEQYRSGGGGYASPAQGGQGRPAGPQGQPLRASSGRPQMPEMPKVLEDILPTDPDALKRIAGNLKEMLGDAPFKFRDQVMKDLQHVPNDVATVLTAVNELIANIADNPKAEKFVLNAIQTAVKNDGILGSVGKMLKMTTSFAPRPRKTGASSDSSAQSGGGGAFDDLPVPPADVDPATIRRKKIKIQAEDEAPPVISEDMLADALGGMQDEELPPPAPEGIETPDGGVRRKKISIKPADEEPAGPAENRDAPAASESSGEPARARKIAVTTGDGDSAPVSGGDVSPKAEPKVYRTMEAAPDAADDTGAESPKGRQTETPAHEPEEALKKKAIKVKSTQ